MWWSLEGILPLRKFREGPQNKTDDIKSINATNICNSCTVRMKRKQQRHCTVILWLIDFSWNYLEPLILISQKHASRSFRLICLVLSLRNVLKSSKKVSLRLYLHSPVIAKIDILCDLRSVHIVLKFESVCVCVYCSQDLVKFSFLYYCILFPSLFIWYAARFSWWNKGFQWSKLYYMERATVITTTYRAVSLRQPSLMYLSVHERVAFAVNYD